MREVLGKESGTRPSEKVFESLGGNLGGAPDMLQGAGLDGVRARNDDKKHVEAGVIECSHDPFMKALSFVTR
jgi:hypothetical protein